MTGIPHVEALLIAVSVGYGVMMVWDVTLLYQYFPSGNVSAFFFLRWVDQFLPLAFTGLFINIGLFAASGDHVDGTTAGKSTGAFCRGAVP